MIRELFESFDSVNAPTVELPRDACFRLLLAPAPRKGKVCQELAVKLGAPSRWMWASVFVVLTSVTVGFINVAPQEAAAGYALLIVALALVIGVAMIWALRHADRIARGVAMNGEATQGRVAAVKNRRCRLFEFSEVTIEWVDPLRWRQSTVRVSGSAEVRPGQTLWMLTTDGQHYGALIGDEMVCGRWQASRRFTESSAVHRLHRARLASGARGKSLDDFETVMPRARPNARLWVSASRGLP